MRFYDFNLKTKKCQNKMGKPEFLKSFANHPKSKFWDYQLNNGIEPKDVFKSSSIKYFFKCADCNHIFQATLNDVTRKKDPRWCGYCGGKNLCEDLNCNWCKIRSFESSDKKKFWSKKNLINPRDVTICSGKKYWFDCNICSHSFEIALNMIKSKNRWCPYCANQKLCHCLVCGDKSFKKSKYSHLWSNNNELSIDEIFLNSGKKYLFKCENEDCCHEYYTKPIDINRERRCNFCASKNTNFNKMII